VLRKLFDRRKWADAQAAEKDSWQALWSEQSKEREALAVAEIKKHNFLLKQMERALGLSVPVEIRGKRVLDVGCGPVSYLAREKGAGVREGIDPLEYPEWVYRNYRESGFKVHRVAFEDFETTEPYDVLLFYNALQHFRNLEETAKKAHGVLRSGGVALLSEYLHIPTDSAHIQYLTRKDLDGLFRRSGFTVKSKVVEVRLPGLVELGGGRPVELYVARAAKR
jgi:2-polyprenyl-3-methyl-5-hydroxy-6-metoxy-1,4-benzoquinol methylase